MNKLNVSLIDGVEVVDSREVAELIGKQHKDLLFDICDCAMSNYAADPKSHPDKFFIPRAYKGSTGRVLLYYFLTRKGCDMVANGLTSEKSVLFTKAYETAFEEAHERFKELKIMDENKNHPPIVEDEQAGRTQKIRMEIMGANIVDTFMDVTDFTRTYSNLRKIRAILECIHEEFETLDDALCVIGEAEMYVYNALFREYKHPELKRNIPQYVKDELRILRDIFGQVS